MKHLLIPDTQVAPGRSIEHLKALGNYIVAKKPDVIIHIGDHADMPSLSTYEKKGSKYFHDKNYREDIDSSHVGMQTLLSPLWNYNDKQVKNRKKRYKPRMVMTLGNHEERIKRAVHSDPVLAGTIGIDDLCYEDYGWEVHPFLDIVMIDGIAYSHYFVNPCGLMCNPVGGTIENKLKLLGCSFTMGHQQHCQWGMKYNALGKQINGLVCGVFNPYDEDYLGPQKNRQYWRGVVMKHAVKDGAYDPMMVSLDYLMENYL